MGLDRGFRRIRIITNCSCTMMLLSPAVTWAFGSIGFDTSSFFKSSPDRETSSTTLVLEPRLETEGSILTAQAELLAYAYLSDTSSFTPEAKNLYVATSRRLMPHHQFTLGRRIYDWSIADQEWDFGLWSPRFLWEPLDPVAVGLVGAFYEYRSREWRLLAYASPVAVPERGYPIQGSAGRLKAGSPFFVHPATSVSVLNQQIPIVYDLKYPSIREIIARPSAAISVRYQPPEGPWSSLSYGLMPVHQADIAANGSLNPLAETFDAELHPRFRQHHLLTAEGGFRYRYWAAWASLSQDSPLGMQTPAGWFYDPVGPATVGSLGASLGAAEGFQFHGSFIAVNEKKPAAPDQDVDLSLPSRFPYTRAVQAGARWRGVSRWSCELSWTHDLAQLSNWVAGEIIFQPGKWHVKKAGFGWTFAFGADLIMSESGVGWIGQYQGDDRIRGRITYAF